MKHPVYAMCGAIIGLLIMLFSISLYRLDYDIKLINEIKSIKYKGVIKT